MEGYNGTGIPFLMDSNGHCQAIMWPEANGVQMAAVIFRVAMLSTAEMAPDLQCKAGAVENRQWVEDCNENSNKQMPPTVQIHPCVQSYIICNQVANKVAHLSCTTTSKATSDSIPAFCRYKSHVALHQRCEQIKSGYIETYCISTCRRTKYHLCIYILYFFAFDLSTRDTACMPDTSH